MGGDGGAVASMFTVVGVVGVGHSPTLMRSVDFCMGGGHTRWNRLHCTGGAPNTVQLFGDIYGQGVVLLFRFVLLRQALLGMYLFGTTRIPILMMTLMVVHCQYPLPLTVTDSQSEDGDEEPEVEVVWAKVSRGVWGQGHVFDGKLFLTCDICKEDQTPKQPVKSACQVQASQASSQKGWQACCTVHLCLIFQSSACP